MDMIILKLPPPQKRSFLKNQEVCLNLLILFLCLLLLNTVSVANARLQCSFNAPHVHPQLAMAMGAHRRGATCSSRQLCFSYTSGTNLAVPCLNLSHSVTVPVSAPFKD